MGSYQNSAPQSNFTGLSQELPLPARLFAASLAHLQAGIPVFPLIGGDDLATGKRPALRWARFRQALPTQQDITRWFLDGAHTAYGVVCGGRSGIIVLDLDDAATADRLAAQFPALMQTRLVTSGRRGTPHLYWRADFPVTSRQLTGADLKAAGGYVVGAGSVIAGHTWTLTNDAPIRAISRQELQAVLAALGANAPASAASQHRAGGSPPAPANSGGDLARHYQQRVKTTGQRNNSLFAVACRARNLGYTQAQTTEHLAPLHARMPAAPDHPPEREAQRLREAARTIASAYSRPPQPISQDAGEQPDAATSTLPNSLREALLQRADGVAILRTLEGLQIKGIQPGAVLTEQQTCRLLQGLVGRYSIRKAFAATRNGEHLFTQHPMCPSPAPSQATAEQPAAEKRQKSALSPGSNRIQQKKGRPAKYYTMPDTTRLCNLLDVSPTANRDPIQAEDLQTRKTYRLALQREFIKRRPGVYFQAVLAARLGVSDRTIRRYHREIPVHTLPQYVEMPVFWFNLDRIPSEADIKRHDIPTGGQFLQDDTGKRWPVKREIARKLLGQGRRVVHKRQTASFYYYGDTPPLAAYTAPPAEGLPPRAAATAACQLRPAPAVPKGTPLRAPPESRPIATASPPAQPDSASPAALGDASAQLPLLPESPPRPDRRSIRRRYRHPLPDSYAEQLAKRAQQTAAGLSLVNARQLVDVYGPEIVSGTLGRLHGLAKAGRIQNAAGFLVSAARAAWRAKHGSSAPMPRFESQPPRQPRHRAPAHPAQDPAWRSAAYRAWRRDFFGWDADPLPAPAREEELPY